MGWALNLRGGEMSPYSTSLCCVSSLSLSFLMTKRGIITLTSLQGSGRIVSSPVLIMIVCIHVLKITLIIFHCFIHS